MKPINIQGYEHYLVDKSGVIYSTLSTRGVLLDKPKTITQVTNKNTGYMQVVLQNKKLGLKPKAFYVHRLVGLTYIPNPENKPQINHIIPNKKLNSVWNLEWCTASENQKHVYKSGYIPKSKCKDIISNKTLLEEGLQHYKQYGDARYLCKIWDCTKVIVDDVLVKNGYNPAPKPKYTKIPNHISVWIEEEVKKLINIKGTTTTDFVKNFVEEVQINYGVKFSTSLYYKMRNEFKSNLR